MNYVVDFAGVAGAIGLSVALALGLEWVTLRGLMRLMPARALEPNLAPSDGKFLFTNDVRSALGGKEGGK